MSATIIRLPSDYQIAVLAIECDDAWVAVHEIEDNLGADSHAQLYKEAVRVAESFDDGLALTPAETAIGVRMKYAVARSRLAEFGGRPMARRSAARAGLAASIARDEAKITVDGVEDLRRRLPRLAHP